ncbi:MAG: hypothetical protein J5588_10505 [Bacteroidales bacterium]|nr:hypothetical protein [Bacteroidales bacterium]
MKKTLSAIVFSLLLVFQVSAQVDNTMYFMDRLPQSSWINPAQSPDCKFHIGGLLIPLFGQLPPSMMFSLNIPIDYNDVIFHGEGEYSDSLITPLHPTANFDDFLKKLRKVNNFSTELQLDFLNFGFKAGEKSYVSFDLSERMFFNFGLPRSLIEFAAKGNDVVREADFTGLGVNVMDFHQFAIGYKREFSKKFSLGFRAKMLVGVADVHTKSSHLVLTTAEKTNYMRVESEYTVSTNVPLEVKLDEEGYVEDISMQSFDDQSVGSLIKQYGVSTGSYGFAMDWGFASDINSSLSCYFSIEDLGFIDWKRNAASFSLYDEDSMRFEGVKVNDLDAGNFENVVNLDSIVGNFNEITYTEGDYRTWLPTKFYLGAKYKFAKRASLGALAKFELLPHSVRPSITLSANFKPFKFTAATISYSYLDGNFNNLGLGFTVHPGCFQWYLVSDNLLGAALFPANTRSVGVRMGCNLVFGCVKKDNKHSRGQSKNSLTKKGKPRNSSVIPYSNDNHKK